MVYHHDMVVATSERVSSPDPDLDLVFRALRDPTRRAIVVQLANGEATMTQIANQFDMSLPGVSKHVGVLEDAGLVRRWRVGRARRCRLETENLAAASEWIATQTEFWSESLEALAAFVEEAHSDGE